MPFFAVLRLALYSNSTRFKMSRSSRITCSLSFNCGATTRADAVHHVIVCEDVISAMTVEQSAFVMSLVLLINIVFILRVRVGCCCTVDR
jgi:hypothetical protein